MTDLHVHTNFCDGQNSPEEMVLSAIEKGVKRLGLVVHSYVPFDPLSCVSMERIEDYVYEISLLKKKYADKIEILCGVEQDLYSQQQSGLFDYSIGSVHYLKQGGKYKAVDDTPEIFGEMLENDYGGDIYSCAEDYFGAVSQLGEKKPDIIGHFDLIKKFRRLFPFDDNEPRYVRAWQRAADILLKLKVPFEVNLGGILRGWIDEPYPSPAIIKYLKQHGAKLILSSDAHRKEDIAGLFGKYAEMI